MTETEWPETAAWDGGATSCETCGTNWDQAEFFWDEDHWHGWLHLGCYSGSSIDAEADDWKSIADWLDGNRPMAGWEQFALDVRALWEKTQMERCRDKS